MAGLSERYMYFTPFMIQHGLVTSFTMGNQTGVPHIFKALLVCNISKVAMESDTCSKIDNIYNFTLKIIKAWIIKIIKT